MVSVSRIGNSTQVEAIWAVWAVGADEFIGRVSAEQDGWDFLSSHCNVDANYAN